MPRTIYVVPFGTQPSAYLAQASAAGASEIAVGIPPALSAALKSADLPKVYVESDPPPAPQAPQFNTPPDGAIAYGEVDQVGPPILVTLSDSGQQVEAGRLAGYTPEAGHYVKLTRLQGQWVVEDRVLLNDA